MSYASYHARDWAENRTEEEIQQEIDLLRIPRDHPWNSVGNATLDEVRMRTLMEILAERKAVLDKILRLTSPEAT